MINIYTRMIDWVDYNKELNLLHVKFKKGSIYQYKDVPLEEYEGLISDYLPDSYFNKNIRNIYEYKIQGQH